MNRAFFLVILLQWFLLLFAVWVVYYKVGLSNMIAWCGGSSRVDEDLSTCVKFSKSVVFDVVVFFENIPSNLTACNLQAYALINDRSGSDMYIAFYIIKIKIKI